MRKIVSSAEIKGCLVPENIPDAEDANDLIVYCARVSNPSNQDNFATGDGLLRYCMKKKHVSIFNMANVVIEVNVPRDISRQILRHVSMNFQEFCVAEGTRIRTKTGSIPIEKLFNRFKSPQYSRASNWSVRVYDQTSKNFRYAKIKEVFDTGVKPVYRMRLDNGKEIVSTKDHKFFTPEGFKRLEDIQVGDFIGTNGSALYQNKEWLENTKTFCVEQGLGLSGIANLAGVSKHTIRKWLKAHKLQFTKKEVASYCPIWNKGIEKSRQPMNGKFMSMETRALMRQSSKKGVASNLYTGANSETWRHYVARFCKGYHTELLQEQEGKCALTGKTITRETSEIDHILPVATHPWLAFEKSNLQVLSVEAHQRKTASDRETIRQTVRYSAVSEIKYEGETQTYDLEVDHVDHNYVANGILTHNSQRYANVNELGFVTREARKQHPTNRQMSIPLTECPEDVLLAMRWAKAQKEVQDLVTKHYNWAIGNGIAKECARVILPEGNTMSRMYINATLRDWFFYCAVRLMDGVQQEHIDVANQCYELLVPRFPWFADAKEYFANE